MDSPTYPTWYSRIGRTVGFGGPQWDGQWIPMDSPTCPMVQWDFLLCTMDSDGKLGHPSLC